MHKKGFTLIEIIVTVSIIGLLVGGSLIGVSGYARNARNVRRRADLESLRSALEQFKSNRDDGSYPTTAQGLNILVTTGYIATQPRDPSPPNNFYTYTGCLSQTSCSPVCTNTGTSFCTSYRLSTTLEGGGTVTLTPLTIQ